MDDVAIAGAGPTGLVLALWLTRLGMRVRILDKTAGPGTTSRAMGVQARTLELYRQLDLAEEVVAAGTKNPAINLWALGKRKARLSFGSAGAKVTPYPFLLVYPQDQHEQLLIRRLGQMGVHVERRTELIDFEERGDCVALRTRGADGAERLDTARFLAGCDGARSLVRNQLGASFAGGTYEQLFYVADVEAIGAATNGEIHVSLESADFVVLLNYGGDGRARLIGTVRDDRSRLPSTLSFDDVGHRALAGLGLQVRKVHWFSTYRVHHRVTDRYRQGRVFLLGDAAHIHSPAGGQGMNTGIGDAVNLAWKLAAVLQGDAPDMLLDSYEAERIAFARRLVDTTDRMFSFITAQGSLADVIRTRIAPLFAGVAYRSGSVRELLFRLISQTMLNYRAGPLSAGAAGAIHSGDRLPWVAAAGRDNYDPLREICWQVHVYGSAEADLARWCHAAGMPLHVFDWDTAHEQAGFARDAIYLLRPDTYVAYAGQDGSPRALQNYFRAIGYARYAA